jgi:hypothetical protein
VEIFNKWVVKSSNTKACSNPNDADNFETKHVNFKTVKTYCSILEVKGSVTVLG